jgi:hypothetical protein
LGLNFITQTYSLFYSSFQSIPTWPRNPSRFSMPKGKKDDTKDDEDFQDAQSPAIADTAVQTWIID